MGKVGKLAVVVVLVIAFLFAGLIMQEAGVNRLFIAALAYGLYKGARAMFKQPEEPEVTVTLDKQVVPAQTSK